MKPLKTKTLKNAGANSAAPIVVALLAAGAVGAVAYAKRRELAKAGAKAAGALDPVVTGAKTKLGNAIEAVVTRGGDIVINFGEAIDRARKMKIQRARNRDTFPQEDGQTRRAA